MLNTKLYNRRLNELMRAGGSDNAQKLLRIIEYAKQHGLRLGTRGDRIVLVRNVYDSHIEVE